jgi:hypothetical protein
MFDVCVEGDDTSAESAKRSTGSNTSGERTAQGGGSDTSGELATDDGPKHNPKRVRRDTYTRAFLGRPVCRKALVLLMGVGEGRLQRTQKGFPDMRRIPKTGTWGQILTKPRNQRTWNTLNLSTPILNIAWPGPPVRPAPSGPACVAGPGHCDYRPEPCSSMLRAGVKRMGVARVS